MSTPRALLVAVVLSLVATRSTGAQTAIPREQLEAAHTAFLVNAGAGGGTFEDVTKALQQWGRFTPEPIPVMVLGRLAIDREHQGKGLAR